MRITTRQLRNIIREEASRALLEADDAGPAAALAAAKKIAAIGDKLMGAGNRAAGMLHGYRNDPRLPDKLAEAVAQIEKEFTALEAAVATLKREAFMASGKKNIAAVNATKAAQQAKETTP